MLTTQRVALLLIGLVVGASCQNVTTLADEVAQERQQVMELYQDLVRDVGRRQLQEGRREVSEARAKGFFVAVILKQLLPLISNAIANAVTTVIVNWFYPLKVNPTIPGKVDFTRIWTAPLPWFAK